MKNLTLMAAIVFILTTISCTDDDAQHINCDEFNKILNDTIHYISESEGTVYNLDIDSNGEVDAELILKRQNSIGGTACFTKLKIVNELFHVESKTKLVPICQDTLNWQLDPSVEYYQNIDCDDTANAIRIDTIEVPKIFQDGNFESVETLQNPNTEVLLYSHHGIGASGIIPGAVFNDINSSAFEDSNSSGWLIFGKNNDELYGLKVALDLASNFDCQPVNILELRRIDCN